jgi:1-acyl-sn-glycerol-3-phosphate acyltransferase
MLFAVFQYIGASISWVILRTFTRFSIIGIENLKEVTKPFIVAANHESLLDPQLTGVALLHRPSLFPLRYMAKNELFSYPILGQVIWLLGAFKAHRKQGIGKSLLRPTKILERKGGIIMFPEGRIIPERPHLGEGRRGAAILSLTTRAQLVPVSLHTPSGLTLWRLFTTRPTIVINIGEPFYLDNLQYPDFSDENTYAATREIMQKISDLYYRHQY